MKVVPVRTKLSYMSVLLGFYRVAECTQTMVTKWDGRSWKVEEQRQME